MADFKLALLRARVCHANRMQLRAVDDGQAGIDELRAAFARERAAWDEYDAHIIAKWKKANPL